MFKISSLSVLLLLTTTFSSAENDVGKRDLWCVAKNNANDEALQAALDWACGQGGADCSAIQTGGACYGDVLNMASWAFNNYYLKNGVSDDACVFSNTAALTSLNPSHGKCKFPSSLSVTGGSNSSSTTTATEVGFGSDSADLSSSGRIWFRPFMTSYLCIVTTVICLLKCL